MDLCLGKSVIHVEVCLQKRERCSETFKSDLALKLKNYIMNRKLSINTKHELTVETVDSDKELAIIQSFLIECQGKGSDESITKDDLEKFVFHYYTPHRQDMELEMFENDGDGGCDGEQVPSSSHWLMPSKDFVGLWENLIYEEGLKDKLLRFAFSALLLSQHNVNRNIISCNRLILLHGPPGTGKTSLCKALTQKLAIRIGNVFPYTHLIEINSHSLFSKWFSESGKLVMRLFAKIRDLVQCPKNLVCVLIDEVESLAYARNSMSGQEPKDAMRVVNALLTQLDSIKEEPNVLVLATSNLADSIDLAFLDRADIKQYIGLPNASAIRCIYETMLKEMMRANLIRQASLEDEVRHDNLLTVLSKRSIGLSGRTLRKLPFLALAEYTLTEKFDKEDKICLGDFLDSMLIALEKHKQDHLQIRNKVSNVITELDPII